MRRVVNVELTEVGCCRCGQPWWWPKSVDQKRRRDGKTFYCPYCSGNQHYIVGKTKEQKLKEQLAAVKADAEQMAACCNNLESQVAARDKSIHGYKGVVGRMRNKLARKDSRK